jgi:hypothetical protein
MNNAYAVIPTQGMYQSGDTVHVARTSGSLETAVSGRDAAIRWQQWRLSGDCLGSAQSDDRRLLGGPHAGRKVTSQAKRCEP